MHIQIARWHCMCGSEKKTMFVFVLFFESILNSTDSNTYATTNDENGFGDALALAEFCCQPNRKIRLKIRRAKSVISQAPEQEGFNQGFKLINFNLQATCHLR